MDAASRFSPGATAPRSGVYRVPPLRPPHAAFRYVPVGTVFPQCKRCGDKVRFVPVIAAEPINLDVDFIEQDFAA